MYVSVSAINHLDYDIAVSKDPGGGILKIFEAVVICCIVIFLDRATDAACYAGNENQHSSRAKPGGAEAAIYHVRPSQRTATC